MHHTQLEPLTIEWSSLNYLYLNRPPTSNRIWEKDGNTLRAIDLIDIWFLRLKRALTPFYIRKA